jgi:hypothetical protein
VTIRIRERLPEQLHHPFGRRVGGDAEMQDAAAAVIDHEETVQQSEAHRRDGEEVDGSDGLAVVVQKRELVPGCVFGTGLPSRQIAGDRALRNDEAELEQLAVDSRSAPGRIVARRWPGNPEYTPIDSPSAAARANSPEKPKSSTMPAYYRFRPYHDQRLARIESRRVRAMLRDVTCVDSEGE